MRGLGTFDSDPESPMFMSPRSFLIFASIFAVSEIAEVRFTFFANFAGRP